MSVISGTLGAVLGSSAQNKATRANLAAAREQNALNYRMFQEGRGSTGSAILPLYFQDREKNLARDAMNFYDESRSLLGSPTQQFRRYSEITDKYQPLIDAGTGALQDVYSGEMTENRLDRARPVFDARTSAARAQSQGITQGLDAALNKLDATMKKAGFSGTGSMATNLALNQTIGARQAAAEAMAMANLENELDRRSIYDQGQNLRLQFLDAPFQRGQAELAMEMMPMDQVQANFSRSLRPFDFFRIAPSSFRADPLPMQGADTTLPAIMSGIGNFNQQLAAAYLGGGFGGAGWTPAMNVSWGGSTMTPAARSAAAAVLGG